VLSLSSPLKTISGFAKPSFSKYEVSCWGMNASRLAAKFIAVLPAKLRLSYSAFISNSSELRIGSECIGEGGVIGTLSAASRLFCFFPR
jgi:hypothetical protein